MAARWAHNPKVGGSSPPPATTLKLAKKLTFFNAHSKKYIILTFNIIKYKIIKIEKLENIIFRTNQKEENYGKYKNIRVN